MRRCLPYYDDDILEELDGAIRYNDDGTPVKLRCFGLLKIAESILLYSFASALTAPLVLGLRFIEKNKYYDSRSNIYGLPMGEKLWFILSIIAWMHMMMIASAYLMNYINAMVPLWLLLLCVELIIVAVLFLVSSLYLWHGLWRAQAFREYFLFAWPNWFGVLVVFTFGGSIFCILCVEFVSLTL